MGLFIDIAIENINETLKHIDLITDNSKFKNHYYYFHAIRLIHNSVHSLLDCYERMNKSKLLQEEDTLFRAFAYLNNQIKHDENLKYVSYAVSGSSYPRFYPYRYGAPGLLWSNFTDNGRKDARGKRCHYEEALMEKDVKKTFLAIKSVLEKENNEEHSYDQL